KPYEVLLGVSTLNKSYTVADLNSLLFETFKFPADVASNLLVRIKADIKQYNGAASTVPSVYSDTVNLTVTPYSTKPQPKYPVPDADGLYQIIVDFIKGTYTVTPATPGAIPANLYIVGDATSGGWNNPVPVPQQQFTQLSSAEFEITIPLITGKSYLFLPVNG